MKTKILLVLFISLFAFISCSDDESNNDPTNSFPQEVEFTVIADYVIHELPFGLSGNNENLIITNEDDWITFMENDPWSPYLYSETNINFDDFQVIASFGTLSPFGPEDVQIISVVEYMENITINVQYTLLDPNCISGSPGWPGAWPYYIIKIPKSSKPIEFTTNTIIIGCDGD